MDAAGELKLRIQRVVKMKMHSTRPNANNLIKSIYLQTFTNRLCNFSSKIFFYGALAYFIPTHSTYADAPLNYMHGSGNKAYPVVNLTWGLLAISVVVILIVTFLVLGAIYRRPGISNPKPGEPLDVSHSSSGLSWVWIGVGLTTIVLLGSIIWTVLVLNEVRPPASRGFQTIEITGHQWWWEARYLSSDPAQIFTTANEIHIPTGAPVFFKLTSSDVIHSFWVPALSGKTDTIPGLTNETWMEAKNPGVYRGQCTEYCGLQHAKMGLLVIAQTPNDFAAWREHQLQSPDPPENEQIAAGAAEFEAHCASCHSIRGTNAAGEVGPNLSHFKLRQTLAAGILPNDEANLKAWLSDPQALKPGSLMPKTEVSKDNLDSIRTYLMSLQ